MMTDWIQISSALLTPVIALIGVALGIANYLHARRKRKDELFDRRYAFYRTLRNAWLSSSEVDNDGGFNRAPPDLEDLAGFAEEAQFLFGNDIRAHVVSLADKRAPNDFFPDLDFVEPFERYLKL
jgi:hypothetical protein